MICNLLGNGTHPHSTYLTTLKAGRQVANKVAYKPNARTPAPIYQYSLSAIKQWGVKSSCAEGMLAGTIRKGRPTIGNI